jgi:hypothetical protein
MHHENRLRIKMNVTSVSGHGQPIIRLELSPEPVRTDSWKYLRFARMYV